MPAASTRSFRCFPQCVQDPGGPVQDSGPVQDPVVHFQNSFEIIFFAPCVRMCSKEIAGALRQTAGLGASATFQFSQ